MKNKKIFLWSGLIPLFMLGFLVIRNHTVSAADRGLPAPGGSSGGSQTLVCADLPVQINLPAQLVVNASYGDPEVIVDWSSANGEDPYLSAKVDTFIDFLKKNPSVGKSGLKVKNLFADHVHKMISKSASASLQGDFETALGNTIQTTQALSHRNIEDVYHDYYPYLFVYELKNNPALAQAFLDGLENGLKNQPVTPSQLLTGMAPYLKNSGDRGRVKNTLSCVSDTLKGMTLEDFKPGARNSIYGLQDANMQKWIKQIQEDGKVDQVLISVLNDTPLISSSRNSANIGVHALFNEWSKNTNIKNFIQLYQSDKNVSQLVDTFFASSFGKKLDQCVREGYGDDLKPKAKAVYLELLESELSTEGLCTDDTAEAVYMAVKSLVNPTAKKETRQEMSQIVMNFINDYLDLEQRVGDVNDASAPFNEVYQNALSSFSHNSEQMTVELYRDGELIHQQTNPNITRYIDRDLPKNDSGQAQNHQYYIKSKTACDVKVGNVGQATIEPALAQGSPVNVSLDVSIKLKDAYDQYFMERLNFLLSALAQGSFDEKFELKNATQALASPACSASREQLLQNKSSDQLVDYVLACFGNGQNDTALQSQTKAFVNPLIRFLDLNDFIDVDQVTKNFLAPVLEQAQEEFELRAQVLAQLKPLAKHANELLKVKSIASFTSEQKETIKCGGYDQCPMAVQNLVKNYFKGASHAANISVEVYDSNQTLIQTQDSSTDLFGEVENLSLKQTLKAGDDYTLKLRLKDAPYALPKVTPVKLNSAMPQANGTYQAKVSLKSSTPYSYGNFNQSDDVIDIKDIQAWAKLLEDDPAQWSAWNIDSLTGVDLLDVTVLQSNWKAGQSFLAPMHEISSKQLSQVFGYSMGDGSQVDVPEWLLNAKSCQ